MRYAYLPESLTALEKQCPVCQAPNTEPAAPVDEAPRVRARVTLAASEIADGRGQAMSTGALAVEHGWTVEPLHFVRADGVQVSVLRLWHAERTRVLFVEWTRTGTGAWAAGAGLTWVIARADSMLRCNVTVARELIKGEPE